jgi:transposase
MVDQERLNQLRKSVIEDSELITHFFKEKTHNTKIIMFLIEELYNLRKELADLEKDLMNELSQISILN